MRTEKLKWFYEYYIRSPAGLNLLIILRLQCCLPPFPSGLVNVKLCSEHSWLVLMYAGEEQRRQGFVKI